MNTSALCTSLHRACIIALTAMVAGPTAQAADETLTLACQGTATSKIGATDQPKREPISFGLIVNLTTRTVEGFPAENLPLPVKVTAANQATIQFDGSTPLSSARLSGTIDRVTGEVSATFTMDPAVVTYALKCRPAQRMF